MANDFYSPDRLYRIEGGGRFTEVIREAVPHTPWFSMGSDVADIDNDGRLDFMGSDMSGTNHLKQKIGMGDMENTSWFLTFPEPRQYMRNAVYLNTGRIAFSRSPISPAWRIQTGPGRSSSPTSTRTVGWTCSFPTG